MKIESGEGRSAHRGQVPARAPEVKKGKRATTKTKVPSGGVRVSRRRAVTESDPAIGASPEVAMLLRTDDPVKKAIIMRYLRAMADALNGATDAGLEHVLAAATDAGSAAQLLSMRVDSNDAILALDPTVPAIMRGIAMKRDLLERAGGVLSTASVADLLGITSQAVVKRARSGSLLALMDASGHLQFPAAQFTDGGTIAGLKEVLAAFNVESSWTRLAVLLDTDEGVGGRRLIDALRAGDLRGVLDAVRSFGA